MRGLFVSLGLLFLLSACVPPPSDKPATEPAPPVSPKVTSEQKTAQKKETRRKTSLKPVPRPKPSRPGPEQVCENRLAEVDTFIQTLNDSFFPTIRNNFPAPLDLTPQDIALVTEVPDNACEIQGPIPVGLKVKLAENRFNYRLDGRKRQLLVGVDTPRYSPTIQIFSSKLNTLSPGMTLGDYKISVRLERIEILDGRLRARYQIINNTADPMTVTSIRLQVLGDRLKKELGHRIPARTRGSYTLEHFTYGSWSTVSATLNNVTPNQYSNTEIAIQTAVRFQHQRKSRLLKGTTRQTFQTLAATFEQP